VPAMGFVAKHGEDEPQAHRRHTHTGFRPEACETSASTISATPAPESVTDHGRLNAKDAGPRSLYPSRGATISVDGLNRITEMMQTVA